MQAEAVKNTLRQHLFPHGLCLSASRLETYARCPFRYFLETVLDLKPWEEPEQIFALLPRDRGVLVHAILYDFSPVSGRLTNCPCPRFRLMMSGACLPRSPRSPR